MTEKAGPGGTLFLVSTPIGHLEDLSARARRVLEEADIIACEDTRVTAKLLARYGIPGRRVSYRAHNEQRQATRLLALLREGQTVALVADAGTPGISDPGGVLVRKARAEGVPVVPVPGPSALLAALVASGLPTRPFTFAGFLPSRSGERRRMLRDLAALPHTLVLFESPRRVTTALADMAEILGPREGALCREMTKMHEEVVVDRLDRLAERLACRERIRGEITLVVGPPVGPPRPANGALPELGSHYREALARVGGVRREALRLLARERHVSRRQIYRALLDAGLMGSAPDPER